MKRLLTLLALVAICICSYAYDFLEGVIYYDITSSTKKTVSVTYDMYAYNHLNSYSGVVKIPSAVTHNGTTFSVTSIGKEAFAYCTGLTSINIPNSVTSIEDCALDSCVRLTSVNIPNSVTNIGTCAFACCEELTSVTIPNSVSKIGYCPFAYCSKLSSIVVEGGNKNYDSRDNCNAIIETSTHTLISGCKNTIIPNSVINIGDNAFYGCIGLTAITIPKSVTYIGYSSFYNCM